MWITIEHKLRFRYTDFIRESQLELRVQPRTTEEQTLHSFAIAIGPPSRPVRYLDWNGNPVHYFSVASFHDRIDVDVRTVVETHPLNPNLLKAGAPLPTGQALGELADFVSFGGPVVRSNSLEALNREIVSPTQASVVDQLHGIGQSIADRFEYQKGVTTSQSSTEHVLEAGVGVCQDFAHLHLGLLRLRGIPCRYINGYINVGVDREAQSHAWVEAYCPENGWLAYDATHRQPPDSEYVMVARGRSYQDVPPNRGIFRGNAQETLETEVSVYEVQSNKDVVGFHEEIRSIDVPVHRELPTRGSQSSIESDADPQQQQQQQQQQLQLAPIGVDALG